jgi:hypothetical protein
MEDADRRQDELTVRLIRRAALAGAARAMAREFPKARVLFAAQADGHSLRVAALAGELANRATARTAE